MEKDLRILVIDDDPQIQLLLVRMLTSAGYETHRATHGEEGIRLAMEIEPTLILLDMVLPDIDGEIVCRRIKETPSLAGTIIIILSGLKTSSDHQASALEAGADGFMVKPIHRRELLARIQAIFRIKRMEDELRAQRDALEATNQILTETISQRTQVEESLRKTQNELESRVKARTEALGAAVVQLEHEIEERKRTERELRLSENRFRTTFELAPVGLINTAPDGRLLRVNQRFANFTGYSEKELLGMTFGDVTHPDDLAEALEYRTRLLNGEIQTYSLEKRYIRKTGAAVWANITVTMLRDEAGQAQYTITVIEDISQRKQTEASIQRNYDIQGVINALLTLSLSDTDLEAMLSRALDRIVAIPWLTFESMGGIFLKEDGADSLVLKAHNRMPEQLLISCGEVPFGECLCGRAAERREIVFSDRIDHSHHRTYAGITPYGHYCVPILAEEKVLGVIVLFLQEDFQRSHRAEEFLGTVSNTLAGIIQRKRAEEALRKAHKGLSRAHNQRKFLSKRLIDLLEKNRHQIAMELHDHIGQTLTSCKINLEMIHDRIGAQSPDLGAQVENAKGKVIQAMKDIKEISHGLKPAMLDALGLIPSLRYLFNEIRQDSGIDIRFFSQGLPERFDRGKELAIFRITQEALHNIQKHATAQNIFVNLVRKDNLLSLSIEDDGIGFDRDSAMQMRGGHGPLGLVFMQERTIQLDGEFTIDAKPGEGTLILVEIPI
ncbi:MAG: PAS domain S-box protein [Desulfobacterales bacterium]|nr:PAS domain S-box protein [Desulfobacterales bacterium]